MRIRYIKEDGKGRVDDLPDATARRLIDSGAAEEVGEDEPVTEQQAADQPQAAPARHIAAKTTRRSR